MTRTKRNTALYQFLLVEGYLARGGEAIAEGKRIFRRKYMKAYKANYRQKKAEHTIACKRDEERLFLKAAHEHGMTVAEYIKQASLAYIQQRYLTPKLSAIYEVRQEMIFTRTQIQRVRETKRALFSQSKEEEIETLLQALHSKIDKAFKHPEDLTDVIREALQENPEFVYCLKRLIEEGASKECWAKK